MQPMQILAVVLTLAVDWSRAPEAVRLVAEPYVAGEIRSFTCPPVNDTGFLCNGMTADGGMFQVWARRAPDGVLEAGPVIYGAGHPSEFFTAVRDYVKPASPLQSVRCSIIQPATPDQFPCDAISADGTSVALNAGKQPDGTTRIYGVVARSSGPAPRWIPFAIGGVFVTGALLLTVALIQIARTRKRLVVVALPLVAEQNVRFPAAGAYVMHAEAPLLSTLFLGLRYSLADTATGREVSSFPALLRARTSGFSRGRIALRRFFVEHEGEHVLRISGLPPDRDASRAAVIFSRSWPLLAYLWIMLAIAGGICLFVGMFGTIVVVG